MVIVSIFTVGGQEAEKQRSQVHEQVQPFAIAAEHKIELRFYQPAEQLQWIHIEKQVRVIGMNKPAGKEPVKLVLIGNRRRVKYQVFKNFIIAESRNGNNTGNDNDNKGYW